MKILSFDQATVVSGFSVWENGQYVESGIIKKNSKTLINERTQDMAKSICQKIRDSGANLVVIEDIQNQSSTLTVIQLARLQGAILFYCANKGIECKILRPSEWRSALQFHQGPKVKREELKMQSVDYVKNMGLDIKSEDECEAICINVAAQKIFD